MTIRYRVDLNEAEQTQLAALLNGGSHAVRKIKRAQILLAADAGVSDEAIASSVSVDPAPRRPHCQTRIFMMIPRCPGRATRQPGVARPVAPGCWRGHGGPAPATVPDHPPGRAGAPPPPPRPARPTRRDRPRGRRAPAPAGR